MRILRKPVTVSDGNQRNEMTVGVNCLFDWVGPNQTLRNGSKGHPSESHGMDNGLHCCSCALRQS